MKSAIEEMLFSNRGNLDSIKNSEEGEKLLDEVVATDEALRAKLDPEQTELLKKFQQAIDDASFQDNIEYYKEGFRFGFLLALDVLDE